MDQAIVMRGANARAAGVSVFDNPFLKAANCPAATGGMIAEWLAKERAWDFGWQMEDAVRA